MHTLPPPPSLSEELPSGMQPLYRRLAEHYLTAIRANTLPPGQRMPSVRRLMRQHGVSLSTALHALRYLEQYGWLEARPRSGYFVRQPRRAMLRPVAEPLDLTPTNPEQYAGIHERVSAFVSKLQQQPLSIDLSGMNCAPELYPVETLKNVAIRNLRRKPSLLTKSPEHSGNAGFRAILARRALTGGMHLTATDIVVTNGCIEAINVALRAVAQAGDTIAVESPTYFGLLQALDSLGMVALEIPTSPQTGISLEALELAMRSHPHIKAVVVVPNLQNPLGCIMPDANKARLVSLCELRQIPLIEDDTYTELADVSVPLKALKAWDTTGNVIHCASLNKVLAPGMRLGWLTAGRWQARVEMLKYAYTRGNEEWTQMSAADFLDSSAYERHLRRLRNALKQQREQVAEAVAEYFPEGTRLNVSSGGIGLWVELPQMLTSDRVFEAALKEGIGISPGLIFSNSNRYSNYLRLCCGQPYTGQVEQALKRLGGITKRMLEEMVVAT
ncbi:PLP-dependent aminotransferase family protein [Herbaspirillum sp. RTI4]|uniref:aminotransferase-like domain-containing protein n=1 Tax=Herbaspirillum sp. RTI4 TaxID=3048640 RepID=UPI002AB4E1C7|nr:PLP-dependent aminotransferase family protein [Herbaspirillum sp. RTI4]MDY7578508.1 PLP-dependent aminotransferase family protein [Herbaspirillum sp. RTI4]MEA9981463.1 PLP-dependent aminotransferase family protein [Herbaspirillum sp. RTI4]